MSVVLRHLEDQNKRSAKRVQWALAAEQILTERIGERGEGGSLLISAPPLPSWIEVSSVFVRTSFLAYVLSRPWCTQEQNSPLKAELDPRFFY